MPKVSVIIPVYQVEKYIERCARSLFEQTLDDIEFLFIDDCSPDASIQVLKRVLEDYPHRKDSVIIHQMEHNSGQAAVREWGILNASGDFVIHCDSDDWVDKDLIRHMYEKAIADKADVAVCDFILTNGVTNTIIEVGCGAHSFEEFLQRLLFKKESWSLCNKLFSRDCFKDICFPNGNMGEDMVLTIQMLLKCHRLSYTPGIYYYYYLNDYSITNHHNVSNHVKNFNSLKENTDLLITIIEKSSVRHKQWIVNSFQYNATNSLVNLMHADKYYRKLWMNTYPGANFRYMFNPYVRFKSRIMCVLELLWIHPFKRDRIAIS